MLGQQDALRFIMLNSCDSIATGVELHNALMLPIIAQNAAIDDAAAVRFAEAFYRNIGAGQGLHQAVESARKVLATLFRESAATPALINGSRMTIETLVSKLDSCTGEMKVEMSHVKSDVATLRTASKAPTSTSTSAPPTSTTLSPACVRLAGCTSGAA